MIRHVVYQGASEHCMVVRIKRGLAVGSQDDRHLMLRQDVDDWYGIICWFEQQRRVELER